MKIFSPQFSSLALAGLLRLAVGFKMCHRTIYPARIMMGNQININRVCSVDQMPTTRLFSTFDEEYNGGEACKCLKKENLSALVKLGKYAFASVGLVLMLLPDHSMRTLIATKFGGAAGYAMAGGLCHILQGANDHDRMNSDTYKRLSIGLLGFSLIGLAAVPAEVGFFPAILPPVVLNVAFTVLRLLGVMVAFLGWWKGVDKTLALINTPKKLSVDLFKGMRETIKGLKVQDKRKAMTYRNFLVLILLGIVSAFMEGVFNMRAFNRGWMEVSLQWSAVSRLFMLSSIIYSLKDAAERDRLSGTTFIQLNLMVGLWAALVGIGQSIYPLGFAAYRGVEMFAFSAPFFIKAYKSVKDKIDK